VRPETRRLDEALSAGIYELDVTLRRQAEMLLRPSSSDRSLEASGLRSTIEASSGRLAATLDLAGTAQQHHVEWTDLSESFDVICNDLDYLLALAGAPRHDP
jgi:hypothetical protein